MSKKPRVLCIDDQRPLPADRRAKTYDESIKALQEEKWDYIYCDDHLSNDPSKNEGIQILEWLKDNPQYIPKHIILVTDDPKAHKSMTKIIDSMESEGDKVSE